ncbi:MAG: hypothetical protein V3V82_06205, partial [Acidimicrobiia bacterium]
DEGPTLGYGIEPLTRKMMRRRLVGRGVEFHKGARISRIESSSVEYVDEMGAGQKAPFDHLVLAYDWEPDEQLVESLQGEDFRVVPVEPCQQPALNVQAFREGSAIRRAL